MKKLIVVRHGQYDSGGHLNDLGYKQMATLAKKLASFTSGASILIITSTADRARESAEVLGVALDDVGIQEHEVLRPEFENLAGVLKLVRENETDVLILVTHHEYAEKFPKYFGQKELGTELHSHPIGKGEAWVLDVAQKNLTHVA